MMKKRILLCFFALVAMLYVVNVDDIYAAQTEAVAYSEDAVFSDKESAVKYLNDELMSQSNSITLTLSKKLCGKNNVEEVIFDIIYSTPVYYDTLGVDYYTTFVDGGVIVEVYPSYALTAAENTQLVKTIENVLKELKLDGKSEYEKVTAIHDYICDRVDYDFTYSKFTSYDALITGSAVCQGYSNLFFRMLYEVGVDSQLITGIGNGDRHSWNIVKIGDVYYNVDLTWDGQDPTTNYSYFLESEAEFDGHYRDDMYTTKKFFAEYPMAEDSWMNFNEFETGMNLNNIASGSFTTIDGGKVSNQAENGRGKLLLFGAAECGFTQQTLINVASADFSDVDVIFLEATGATADAVAKLKQQYGQKSDDIIYAYNADYMASMAMWAYIDLVGVDVTTYPVLVYIDNNNKLQFLEASVVSSAKHIREKVSTWTSKQAVVSFSNTSMSLDSGSTKQLSVSVYETKRNGQFFKWSSSDTSVATVDVNGKVKGVKAGTATITCKVNDSISFSCKVTVLAVIPDGLNKAKDGKWYYYTNNKVNTSYTGMAKNQHGWWYVKNGKLDQTYTGMAKNQYGWFYMKNGKLDSTYTGMAKNEYGWWYIKNGKLDQTYTGMAKNQYGWWYIKNGKLDQTYTGMAKNDYGWWYLKKGTIDFKYTGLGTNAYGTWYIKNGKLDQSYSGKVNINGKSYTIKKGKVV